MIQIIKSKFKYFKICSFILVLAFTLLSFCPLFLGEKTFNFVSAENFDVQISENDVSNLPGLSVTSDGIENIENGLVDYSIFIKKATFSTIYENRLYVIDEDSGEDSKSYNVKAYNLESKSFETINLPLTGITDIIDATYLDGYFFILSSNGIYSVCLNLASTSCTKLEVTGTDESYYRNFIGIAPYHYTDTTKDEFFIMLTPVFAEDTTEGSSNTTLPELIIYNSSFEFQNKVSVDPSTTDKSTMKKFFAVKGETTINLIFVYEEFVYYFKTDRSILNRTSISSGSENKFTNNDKDKFAILDSAATGISLFSVNVIVNNDTPYMLVTYRNNLNEAKINSYTITYKITISNLTDDSSTKLERVEDFSFNLSYDKDEYVVTDYTITSDNYFVYSIGQEIRFIELNFNGTGEDVKVKKQSPITNPEIIHEYFAEDDFIYNRTLEDTLLLDAPWNSKNLEEAVLIPKGESGTDIIIIGRGYINTVAGEKLYIKDYSLCLYTFDNINHIGFIDDTKLIEKRVLVENGEFTLRKYTKILRVKPDSALYSAPTKVIGDKITDELTSSLIQKIKDNSRIELLDDLYTYTSNNSIFLKVMVNDFAIGYIEVDSLIPASGVNDFVITNSFIKNTGTKVYLEDNVNSPIIYFLGQDKRVRINGTRDTKTGFTNITFNDIYGNEFSGYILNEEVKADHWSTLQIVGCILVAINIGLLILIVYYRDTRIGEHGQKYVKNKKSN